MKDSEIIDGKLEMLRESCEQAIDDGTADEPFLMALRLAYEEIIAALRRVPEHDLYKTGDLNVPSVILDGNGEVVLGLCKRCGKGEADLVEPCERPPSDEMVMVPKKQLEQWDKWLTERNERVVQPPLLTDAIQNEIRAILSAAEAEGRKPYAHVMGACPLCGRTDPHTHTSGPLGMP